MTTQLVADIRHVAEHAADLDLGDGIVRAVRARLEFLEALDGLCGALRDIEARHAEGARGLEQLGFLARDVLVRVETRSLPRCVSGSRRRYSPP